MMTVTMTVMDVTIDIINGEPDSGSSSLILSLSPFPFPSLPFFSLPHLLHAFLPHSVCLIPFLCLRICLLPPPCYLCFYFIFLPTCVPLCLPNFMPLLYALVPSALFYAPFPLYGIRDRGTGSGLPSCMPSFLLSCSLPSSMPCLYPDLYSPVCLCLNLLCLMAYHHYLLPFLPCHGRRRMEGQMGGWEEEPNLLPACPCSSPPVALLLLASANIQPAPLCVPVPCWCACLALHTNAIPCPLPVSATVLCVPCL